MENNPLLNLRIVERYDYVKTKLEVDEIMINFEKDRYKNSELSQPKTTPSYEIKYEMFTNNFIDKVGNYVENKLDKLKGTDLFHQKLSTIISTMTCTERVYFLDYYFRKK